MTDTGELTAALPLGVVVERRAIDNPWQRWRWTPVEVIPGAPPLEDGWRLLASGEGWTRWHAGTLDLVLHRADCEGYLANLANETPVVYVALESDLAAPEERGVAVRAIGAASYETDSYSYGDHMVEGVPMPPGLMAWVQAFCDRHHVETPFRKRRRDRLDPDKPFSSVAPVAAGRRRKGIV